MARKIGCPLSANVDIIFSAILSHSPCGLSSLIESGSPTPQATDQTHGTHLAVSHNGRPEHQHRPAEFQRHHQNKHNQEPHQNQHSRDVKSTRFSYQQSNNIVQSTLFHSLWLCPLGRRSRSVGTVFVCLKPVGTCTTQFKKVSSSFPGLLRREILTQLRT